MSDEHVDRARAGYIANTASRIAHIAAATRQSDGMSISWCGMLAGRSVDFPRGRFRVCLRCQSLAGEDA
jgi:hypothetical protein